MKKEKSNDGLTEKYNAQYSDELTEWREIGGKYKAINIRVLSKSRTFKRVLDCGAGEGSILQDLDRTGEFKELYAIEISDSGISQIEKRKIVNLTEVKKFDGYEIPYPDNYFDMAYCSHVIEHVEHPRLLLRELARVSDYQIIEVPLDYSIGVDKKINHFLSYGHINIYTPSLFKFFLKSEGFEILQEQFNHIADEAYRYHISKNLKQKITLLNEIKLKLNPFKYRIYKLLFGENRYQEFRFSAYTCLTKKTGKFSIF